jgi:membrane associated rhomboid family serine protease
MAAGHLLILHEGFLHILFNMLGLWFFGKDLERDLGHQALPAVLFFCGVCRAGRDVGNYLFGNPAVPTVGASGRSTVFSWWQRCCGRTRIIIFYIFPIKLKYFVMILGAIEFFGLRDLTA